MRENLQAIPWPLPSDGARVNSFPRGRENQSQHDQPRPGTMHSPNNHPCFQSATPICLSYEAIHDKASHNMILRNYPAPTFAAQPMHAPHHSHIDHGRMYRSSDRFNVALPASPPLQPSHESVSCASSVNTIKPPQPAPDSNPDNRFLLDNIANLEKMRRDRDLVFESAALDRDRTKSNATLSATSHNKAWEDAWETMRQTLTKM